jgi:NitT/TauT family transport system substrate-binding protein
LTSRTDMPNYLNHVYFDALESVNPSAVTIIH